MINFRIKLTIVGPLLASLLLVGCETSPLQTSPGATTSKTINIKRASVKALLAAAPTLPSPQREQALLMASKKLLADDEVARALEVLQSLNLTTLGPQEKGEYILLSAQIELLAGDPQRAQDLITSNQMGLLDISSQLESDLLTRISWTRARILEANQNFYAAARERIFLAPMLESAEHRDLNHQRIWTDLVSLPADRLAELKTGMELPELKGWLELAWIYQSQQDDLDQQIADINAWQAQNTGHPAADNLPEAVNILTQLAAQRPTRVALLLPLKGKYEPASRAIFNGFLAAHYGVQKQRDDISIRLYDSSDIDQFPATYQTAVDEGAEVIIGPLQKENLRFLLSDPNDLPVTTIALNSDSGKASNSSGTEAKPPESETMADAESAQAEALNSEQDVADLNDGKSNGKKRAPKQPANLFQFSLAPEDDAREVVAFAQANDYVNASILFHNAAWWQRSYDEFIAEWTQAGGKISSIASYSRQSEMAGAVRSLLRLDQSRARARQLEYTIGTEFKFDPRRRRDIDFVYVMATPVDARQLRPLFEFYYAKSVPLLSGSQIYSGVPDAKKDRDLNSVQFCDIPWLLDEPDAIKSAMTNAWPGSDHRYARLNALGVDAYRLQTRIQLLAAAPSARLFGATGVLSVDSSNNVKRRLTWAEFKRGIPSVMPPIEPKIELITDDSGIQTNPAANPG